MPGKTFNVTNAVELTKAAKSARGGDTILLASGNYGDVLINSLKPTGTVTIKSANPDADAVFDSLKVSRSTNFTFEDVDVLHVLDAGQQDFAKAVVVQMSSNITFVGVDFSGSLNNNANDDGNGLSIQGSTHVAVLDSTFQQFNIAVGFGTSKDVLFAGNTIHNVREGINLAAVDGALVERNLITDVVGDKTRGDHADAIQVHAGGTAAVSSDLTFRSNVIKVGNSAAHGIYIHSEKGASAGLVHKDIVVENNYYEGNARHGITVTYAEDVIVTGNTVRDTGVGGLAPAISIAGVKHGVVTNNIAPLLLTYKGVPNTDTVWTNNIDVWDRLQKKGVLESTLFDTPTGRQTLDLGALDVRDGTLAASNGIGFQAVAGIGDLSGSASVIVASYSAHAEYTSHVAIA